MKKTMLIVLVLALMSTAWVEEEPGQQINLKKRNGKQYLSLYRQDHALSPANQQVDTSVWNQNIITTLKVLCK